MKKKSQSKPRNEPATPSPSPPLECARCASRRLQPFALKNIRIEFPMLDAYDALRFAGLLQHIHDAVWAVHGQGMSEILSEGDPFKTRFYMGDYRDEPDDQPSLLDEDLPF